MAVRVTRQHSFTTEDLDEKMEKAVEEMVAANSLSVTEKQPRKVKIAGMGVSGEVTWDEKEITVEAEMAFAFGAADTQLRTAIDSALDRVCGPRT